MELNISLKDSAGTAGGSRSALGKSLVIVQVALSLTLLIGAGLFVRTLRNLQNVDVGFNRENTLLFDADPRLSGHKGEQIANVYRLMLERIRSLPGVLQASFSNESPLIGSYNTSTYTVLGRGLQNIQSDDLRHLRVEAKFFETIETPLLRGRNLTEQDNAGAPKVAIVNHAFARRFFPDGDPIGTHIFFGRDSNPQNIPSHSPDSLIEIVGVVRDARYGEQREKIEPIIFLPAVQNPRGMGPMAFAVRAAVDPGAMIPAIREAVRQIDSNLPLSGFTTVSAQAEERLVQEHLFARLTSFFGLLSLLLAGIGLYGVMAYSVTQRTREIGVRVALGARAADVLRMFIRQGMALVVIGVAMGLAGAFALTRLVSSFLFDVSPTDPATFAGVALLLALIALFACWLPARRASKVDPIRALRHE